jgi:AI-2 transport protein TqsA
MTAPTSTGRPDASPEDHRHGGLVKTIVLAAAICIVVYTLKIAAGFLIPILVGFWIAALCVPIVKWLEGRGVPRIAAAVLPAGTLLILLVVVGYLAVTWIASLADNIPEYQAAIAAQRADLIDWLVNHNVSVPADDVDGLVSLDRLVGLLDSILPTTINVLVGAVFVILMLGYVLVEREAVKRRLDRALGADSKHITHIHEFISAVSSAMAARAILGAAAAFCDGVLLLILDVPYVGLWVLTSFICSFIPYIGYLLAMVPAVLITLATQGAQEAVIVFFGYWIFNGFFDTLIGPKFQGNRLNLSPVVTIFSVLFWGNLFGAIGGMMALPLTLGIKMLLLDAFPEGRWLSQAIEADVPNPPVTQANAGE